MKKRFKKVLLWTSILGVAVSSISIPVAFYENNASNSNNSTANSNNITQSDDVDYDKVSDYLSTFSQQKVSLQSFVSNNSISSSSTQTLSDKDFQIVNQKQNELLNFL